jgi:predicted nuclease of predicted toxin-antitoxin system
MNNRFLLDQMLDADVADALNQHGFSALRVSVLGMARSADDEILAAAIEQGQILITLDEDFGDWAVLPLQHHPGVIRVKANPATTRNILSVLLPFLKKYSSVNFKDTLVIISERGIRRVHTGDMQSDG